MQELFDYVEEILIKTSGNDSCMPYQSFRKRFEHIKRVYKWMLVISDGLDINQEALNMAVIFHDSGYGLGGKGNHASKSCEIFREFGEKRKYDKDLIDFVCYLIDNHSDKSLLEKDIPLELILLLEADMLDEEGAMAIAWDCLSVGSRNPQSYFDAYKEVIKFSGKIIHQNPMVTKKAKEIWERKRELVNRFIEEFKKDLWIEVEE